MLDKLHEISDLAFVLPVYSTHTPTHVILHMPPTNLQFGSRHREFHYVSRFNVLYYFCSCLLSCYMFSVIVYCTYSSYIPFSLFSLFEVLRFSFLIYLYTLYTSFLLVYSKIQKTPKFGKAQVPIIPKFKGHFVVAVVIALWTDLIEICPSTREIRQY